MGTYNSDPNPLTLAGALAMDAELRQNAVSRYFEQQSGQFNALKNFTSVFDPKTQGGGGPRSIFCEKTDLSKGGAQRVNFNVIGIPGGPGVKGATELTGNTSKSLMGTYPVVVDWVRDAFELTEDEVEMLAAGRSIEQTSVDLLAEKMGLVKQNTMLKRLIDDAAGNVMRPSNRSTTDALMPGDVLTLDLTVEARARLQTLGAKPLMRNLAKSGCPVDRYLVFATASGMLNIRNDSAFHTAISQGDTRGSGNALFQGEILNWQGNPFYEFPVTDQDWDDFAGGPLIAKAIIRNDEDSGDKVFDAASAVGDLVLETDPDNTKSLYFQWFDGIPFVYDRLATLPNLSAKTYYAWACNPDGSRCFLSYAGLNAVTGGNKIVVKNILMATGATNTSTKGAVQVGELKFGTTNLAIDGQTVTTLGDEATVPDSGINGKWVYKSEVQAGAVLIQANANGVPYSRSFVLGSMSACFAHGRVRMSPIKQERDYDFVFGRGFKMIFGTGVCKNAAKRPVGYLLVEHAIEHPGYPVPSYEEA